MTPAIADHVEMTRVVAYHEVQEVLRSSGFWPSMFVRVSGPLLEGTLMTLSVEEHLKRRRTEVVMFSRAQLMDYELRTVVPALREQLEAAFDGGAAAPKVDIMHVMRDALLRVTAKVVGIDDLAGPADVDELRELAEHFGEGSSAEWAIHDREAVVAAAVAAKDRFGERFFRPAMQRRQALLAAAAEVPNDLTTLLLRNYGDWEPEKLLREVIFYVTASANTTTHLAPHVLQEVLAHFERRPEDRAKAGDLSFLQRAVSEGLRLHPTVPALLRLALEDVTLPSGRTFAAGEQLLLDLNEANRDETVFGPTAQEYDPYRPLPPRTTAYGLAFGDGAHTCLGRQVAVGAGNGSVDRDDVPAGVLTRLLQEVLRYEPAIDPADPPVFRENTATMRFARFPVVLRARPAAAAGGCPFHATSAEGAP
ncbi:cytochrome P450 [Dactylosporangium sucinum]|uniref:Cytochrome P450 n=1 Tax=Dactylosporangium sucinum TaxID=1424081 RepID=A0A917TFA2_9ACTN|nr:cytochrome P450 [Dactylosporangium sucinum]GGM20766.1 cytochrome P450 [Dactylosporangium sucinum]